MLKVKMKAGCREMGRRNRGGGSGGSDQDECVWKCQRKPEISCAKYKMKKKQCMTSGYRISTDSCLLLWIYTAACFPGFQGPWWNSNVTWMILSLCMDVGIFPIQALVNHSPFPFLPFYLPSPIPPSLSFPLLYLYMCSMCECMCVCRCVYTYVLGVPAHACVGGLDIVVGCPPQATSILVFEEGSLTEPGSGWPARPLDLPVSTPPLCWG